ncbi:MAG: hypothetical protein CME98_11280 [Hyphomonas sp.]|nr:hypothetical protein [Hyphomonas sp.]
MRWYFGVGILFLTMFVSMSPAKAAQTDNLLPNANHGTDWNSSSTDIINSGSSGVVNNGNTIDGFTVTCPTQQSNCGYKYDIGGDFEVTGTATVSAEDIKLYDNNITQSMLDNGITLESNIDVANCESNQGNCESKGGANDSHTVTITLKDNTGDVLSTLSQTRNEVTGFQGDCNGYPGQNSTGVTADCGQYTDTMIYTGVGANSVDWSWTGIDNNYSNQSRQGPNLLGATLVMTYEQFVLDSEIFNNINTTFNDIDDDLNFDEDIFAFEPDFDLGMEFDFPTFDEPMVFTETTLIPLMDFDDNVILFFEYDDDIEVEEEIDMDTPFIFLGEAPDMLEEEPEFFEETETVMLIETFEEMPEEETETVATEEVPEETEFAEETTEELIVEEELSVVSTEEVEESTVDMVEVAPDTNIVVEANVGDLEGIDKYLAQNFAKMEQIMASEPKIEDKPFYIDLGIYLEQVSIVDNRQLYQDVAFHVFDPVVEYERKLNDNLKKQQELKIKLESLNGVN